MADRAMETLVSKTQSIPWRGVLALVGGFLIQLTLGSFYSFGNMMTYLTSYMRLHGSPDLTYADFILVQSVWGMTQVLFHTEVATDDPVHPACCPGSLHPEPVQQAVQGIVMPLSGFLVRLTGPRPAMFLGCAVFSLGCAATRYTLPLGLPWVAATYGRTDQGTSCLISTQNGLFTLKGVIKYTTCTPVLTTSFVGSQTCLF